jgi:hypothetical protein
VHASSPFNSPALFSIPFASTGVFQASLAFANLRTVFIASNYLRLSDYFGASSGFNSAALFSIPFASTRVFQASLAFANLRTVFIASNYLRLSDYFGASSGFHSALLYPTFQNESTAAFLPSDLFLDSDPALLSGPLFESDAFFASTTFPQRPTAFLASLSVAPSRRIDASSPFRTAFLPSFSTLRSARLRASSPINSALLEATLHFPATVQFPLCPTALFGDRVSSSPTARRSDGAATAVTTAGIAALIAGSVLLLVLAAVLVWVLLRPRKHTTEYSDKAIEEMTTGTTLTTCEFLNEDQFHSFQNANSGDFNAQNLWACE